MLLIIINALLFISFLGFAYVNLNDKDSWLWVPIYSYAALFCGLVCLGIKVPIAYILGILFYLIYAVILFFAKDGVKDWIIKYNKPSLVQSMQASKPYIEKAREFFGLLIAAAALAFNLLL